MEKRRELELKSGCSQQHIRDILFGKIKETGKVIQLSRALECEPDWLFDGSGSKERVPREGWHPDVVLEALDMVDEFCEAIKGPVPQGLKHEMLGGVYATLLPFREGGSVGQHESVKAGVQAILNAMKKRSKT